MKTVININRGRKSETYEETPYPSTKKIKLHTMDVMMFIQTNKVCHVVLNTGIHNLYRSLVFRFSINLVYQKSTGEALLNRNKSFLVVVQN